MDVDSEIDEDSEIIDESEADEELEENGDNEETLEMEEFQDDDGTNPEECSSGEESEVIHDDYVPYSYERRTVESYKQSLEKKETKNMIRESNLNLYLIN